MAETIGGNIAGTKTKLITTFNRISNKRQSRNLKNRFIHLKVSLHKKDSKISSRTFSQIAKRVVQGLGYTNNPYIVYRHHDTDHPHIHIVLGRVTFDGKLVRDSFDGLKQRNLEMLLEKEFELVENRSKLLTPAGVRLPGMYEKKKMKISSEEKRKLRRKGLSEDEIYLTLKKKERGEASIRNYVQMAHLDSVQGNPTGEVYLKRMERRGIMLYRYEFHRGQNVHYGLSYTFDPTKIRGEFESKILDGSIAGVDVNENQFQNHPYFGRIDGSYQINSKGMVQLCLFDTVPLEKEMKPVSFRATNLGPLFKHDELLKMVQFSQEMLQYITVDRSKKGKDKYERKSLVENEPKELSNLLIAAERKSHSRVDEVLSKIDLASLHFSDGTATKEDLAFVASVRDKKFFGQFGQEIPHELREYFKTPGTRELVHELLEFNKKHKAGDRLLNIATMNAIQFVQKSDWDGLTLLYKQSMDNNTPLVEAPDPHVVFLSAMHLDIRFNISNFYFHWHDSLMSATVINEELTEAEKAVEKRKHFTKELIHALTHNEDEKALFILREELADLKNIPGDVFESITNPRIGKILREQLHGVGLDSDETKTNEPKPAPKQTPPSSPDIDQTREEKKRRDFGIE